MKKDRTPIRWKDPAEVLLGFWLLASPLVLGYFHVIPASICAISVGTAVLLVAQLGIADEQPWEEWVNFLLALFLIISPWLFGYSAVIASTVNAVIVGSLLSLLTVFNMIEEYAAQKQHRKPSPPLVR